VKRIKTMIEADIPKATSSTSHIIPTPPTAHATSLNTAEDTPTITPTSGVVDLTSSTSVSFGVIANPSPALEASANLPVVESPLKVPNLPAPRLQQTY